MAVVVWNNPSVDIGSSSGLMFWSRRHIQSEDRVDERRLAGAILSRKPGQLDLGLSRLTHITATRHLANHENPKSELVREQSSHRGGEPSVLVGQ